MRIIDISPLVTESSPVYPGDDPLSIRFAENTHCRVGTLSMSAHLGAHVDAPLHLNHSGDISDIQLSSLLGPCQVIELQKNFAIEPADFPPISSSRVLIKTGFKSSVWTDSFPYLLPAAVQKLIDAGVRVIGIDTPSIDAGADETLPSHVLAIDAGILILENLDLSAARAGHYQLVALPLKIKGLDASPVRAVLLDFEENK